MPNTRIQEILQQIRELNDELRERLREQQEKAAYHLKGKRVEFEAAIQARHKQIRTRSLAYLAQSQWRHLVSAPFIYGMVIPMMILDLALFVYQHTCFRLYRIKRVRRADYIAFDHRHLRYLNTIEKLNCLYCSYGNGLFAYAREIGSLTEQYWCPIKHARRVVGTHDRYPGFLDYGDAEDFAKRAAELRNNIIAREG